MATAKRLPSGNWRVQVTLGTDENGKRIIKSVTAATKREAEFEALQLQLRHKEATDENKMTLETAMTKYIESRDGVLSVTTKVSYESIIRNYFPVLKKQRVSALDREMVQRAIAKESLTHSPKSVRNAYGLLTATLHVYNKQLWRELNAEPIKMPQRVKYEAKVLTPEQCVTLLHGCHGTRMEIPIICGLWLCMRRSEVCGLKWDCVDLDNGKLHIKEALVMSDTRHQTQKAPKTESSDRWVSLHPYVVEVFRKAKETATGEYVVTMGGTRITEKFHQICDELELPRVRFHDLRHSNTSLMALIGVPQYLAQLRGGWSTPTTMNRVYTHQVQKDNAGDTMVNDFFSELLGLNGTK